MPLSSVTAAVMYQLVVRKRPCDVIVKKIDGVKLIVVPDEIETEEPVTNSSEAADNMR